MMKCHNCSKAAMFLTGPTKIPLCLDCHAKLVQVTSMQNEALERQMNFLLDEMDMITGIPSMGPRFPQKPTQQVVQMQGTTFNNINVDRSTIGVLNTGTIQSLDSDVTALKQSGEENLGSAIQLLTQIIVSSTEVQKETRNAILEILSVISSETKAPKEQRRSTAMRPLLGQLAELLNVTTGLHKIWEIVGPIIESAFS